MKKSSFTKFSLVFASLLLTVFVANAQFPGSGSMPGGGSGKGGFPTGGLGAGILQNMKMNIGHVYGKVVDSTSHKPIEFASVALFTMGKDSLVGGQLTETNGDFSIENLPFGAYQLKISYTGYAAIKQKVIITPKNGEQELGDIMMATDAKILKDVTITAEKPYMELKSDRKVYNVEKDASAKGGTGVDVMKNIPGVSVDVNGGVTLRNNTPQIYVDGRPTTLTLEQIPADQIDRIEVITNPSAKFEAAASGGIINVVLKKNQKPGYNGMITLGLGTNAQYNGLALLNIKEKKFGFMLTYSINGATNKTDGFTDRTNLLNGVANNYFRQDLTSTFKRMFQFGRVGFDYYINNRTTLSLSENMVFGKFTTTEDQGFTTSDSLKQVSSTGRRNNVQDASFRNFTTNLNLTHTYATAGKQWTLDLSYNRSKGFNDYLYTTNSYLPNGSLVPFNPELQNSDGNQHTDMVTAQWDLSLPLKKNIKIDLGARSNYQLQYSTLNVNNFNYPSNEYTRDTVLSNNYKIDNLINAAYFTFGQDDIKGFSYQVGLRFEQTYYRGQLLDKNLVFSYQYPSSKVYESLFPSLNLSQKIGDKHELQLNVARKINRPGFFQIAPFVFYSDKFNYRIGNPNLKPEFINQAELNYNLTLKKFNWLSSVYGKYTEQPITSYSYNSPSDSLVLINTSVNADNSFAYGWQNTFRITAVKNLEIMLDGNVFYTSIRSSVADAVISNSGFSYVTKAVIKYTFPLGIIGQVNGTYESPKVIPQGQTTPMYFFDISVSKDLGIVSFNLSLNDVLNSKKQGQVFDTPTYYQSSSRRRETRFAKVGITVRFGKMDSSIFKLKAKMKQGGLPNMNGGDGLDY